VAEAAHLAREIGLGAQVMKKLAAVILLHHQHPPHTGERSGEAPWLRRSKQAQGYEARADTLGLET
jgi:hypothetical protein